MQVARWTPTRLFLQEENADDAFLSVFFAAFSLPSLFWPLSLSSILREFLRTFLSVPLSFHRTCQQVIPAKEKEGKLCQDPYTSLLFVFFFSFFFRCVSALADVVRTTTEGERGG